MRVHVLVLILSVVGLLGAGGLYVFSQAPQGSQSQQVQRTVTISDGGTGETLEGIEVPPIPKAPFQGMLETEWSRPLADGGTWTLANRRRFARDSEGRVYQERWLLAPKGGKAKSVMDKIQVVDPVKHIWINCSVRLKACETGPFRGDAETTVYKPSPEQSGQLRDGAGIFVHEKIGENTIQGEPTIGMRDTTTYNVGILGNDREFSIVREFWYSPKLGFNLLSSRRDGRYGTQKFTMTELTEGEPDASLFDVPQGYRLPAAINMPPVR
jgi:hypothetical protein